MLKKNLFGSGGPTLSLEDPGEGTLQATLDGRLEGGKSFDALAGRLDFEGSAQVGLRLLDGEVGLDFTAQGGAEDALAALGSFSAPDSKRWGLVELRGGVGASVSGAGGDAVTLQLSATGRVAFRYREIRALPEGKTGADALGMLISNARLPFSFDLKSFGREEWHEIELETSLGLDGSVALGRSVTLDTHDGPLADLLPGDAPDTAARLTLLARAAVGLELVDDLRLAAGGIPAERPTWVRCRIERRRRSSVSFGASLTVDLWYNKRVIERLLGAALGEVGYGRVKARLEEIAQALDPDDLSVEALRSRLSDGLFELAAGVLPIDAATDLVANRAAGLLELVRTVRARYERLDVAFQGLVDHLLGTGGLAPGSPLRQRLAELRDLGAKSEEELLDHVLGSGLGELEPLVDLLSREGIGEWLLRGRRALHEEVARLAEEAGGLLEIVETVDDSNLADVLERATGSDRIRRVLAFLDGAPETVTEFRAFVAEKADRELRRAVESIAGRAVEKIDGKRLRRLREWVGRVRDGLDRAASIDEQLAEELEKVRDQIGFVLSFSIDRVTRRTALVDVELDPDSAACRAAFRELARGRVAAFANKLPFETDPSDAGAADADPPFFFHSFVLAAERSTELSWVFATPLGAGSRRTRKAFDHSRIEIAQTGAQVSRQASYGAGLITAVGAADAEALPAWMGAVTLECVATGTGPAVSADYDEVSYALRLTTRRSDDRLDESRRLALGHLLGVFRFDPTVLARHVPPQATACRLEIDLVFGEPAPGTGGAAPVAALFDPLTRAKQALVSDADLDEAFLRAASGWLLEPLIGDRWGIWSQGEALASIVASQTYRERWRAGEWSTPFTLSKGGSSITVGATPQAGGKFAPILQALALVRTWMAGPAARLGRAWDDDPKSHDQLVELTRAFRKLARRSTPALAFWRSPLFQHYLTFERLRQAGALGPARGVATIAWRDEDRVWQPSRYVELPPGE